MAEQTIICPFCKKEIPLTQAITQKIGADLRKEMEEDFAKRDSELSGRENTLVAKEQAVAKSAQEVDKKIEDEVARKLVLERETILKEAKKKAEEENSLQLKVLQEDLHSKDKQLQETQKNELLLRKQKSDLEARERNVDLEVARKIDSERANIFSEASQKVAEDFQLKDKDKDKKIADLRSQIEILNRKMEQGSQQAQGEVLEIELEQMLKSAFPYDVIEAVPKGIKGADVLQKVNNPMGQYCGTIIWESKRTKGWNDDWIDKLKDDQREVKADIAVLMSITLPKEINGFAQAKGVWVTSYPLAIALAVALRGSLVEVANAKQSAVGKAEKMEAIYNYLSGTEFKQKVEAIVEAFATMHSDLAKEKAAMEKLWGKREQQIKKVMLNTARMYGDMQGIIGASLPEIKSLELKSLADETEEKAE
ncbi:MAG: DUF2130 domain-containing protein [Candidatus Omnitrophica bacterium]|nr:DUF2130 domain-containing protein [Candidatus Omnitrophota bacterium]